MLRTWRRSLANRSQGSCPRAERAPCQPGPGPSFVLAPWHCSYISKPCRRHLKLLPIASGSHSSYQNEHSIWKQLPLSDAELCSLVQKMPELADLTSEQQSAQDNIACLLEYCLATEVKSLILQNPRLLTTQLQSWMAFFQQYGFSKREIRHILAQAPEVLVEGDLVTAGNAMLECKRLGLNSLGSIQLTVYYPQLLKMDVSNIATVLKLAAKFQTGVDTLSC